MWKQAVLMRSSRCNWSQRRKIIYWDSVFKSSPIHWCLPAGVIHRQGQNFWFCLAFVYSRSSSRSIHLHWQRLILILFLSCPNISMLKSKCRYLPDIFISHEEKDLIRLLQWRPFVYLYLLLKWILKLRGKYILGMWWAVSGFYYSSLY